MGSVIKGPGGAVYFANPGNKTHRSTGVIRKSASGREWSGAGVTQKTVWPGEYGYSCLTNMPTAATVGLLWETDGPQCKAGSASCRCVFTAFPAAL